MEKESVYITIGISEDGGKEVLDFTVAPTESTKVWEDLVQRLYERGVEHVLLFIADGLNGIMDAPHRVYPKAKHQEVCRVHVSHNIANKVRMKARTAIPYDFKAVHEDKSRQDAFNPLDQFQNNWHKMYPRAVDAVMKQNRLLTFYDFPAFIRSSIYTTNLIEGFHKEIKRYVKRKEQFPNEDAMNRFLATPFLDDNHKFGMQCHKGFKKAKPE